MIWKWIYTEDLEIFYKGNSNDKTDVCCPSSEQDN